MNKKTFGKKIGVVITVLLCAVFAVLFWLFVKFCEQNGVDSISAVTAMIR